MTNIRFRRGAKAELPLSAPSGMPLWCEDTNELYIGTTSGITLVNGAISNINADTLDGYDSSAFALASHTHPNSFLQSFTQNGYIKFPNGLILQWGFNTTNAYITFPIAFPIACFCVTATPAARNDMAENVLADTYSKTNFYLRTRAWTGSASWIAIGY